MSIFFVADHTELGSMPTKIRGMHVCEQANALHTAEVVVAINARANNPA
jgi:hypothetical protein